MENLERRIVLGIVLAIVIYLVIGVWSDLGALGRHLESFPVAVFAGALGLTLVNYVLRFIKWEIYLRALDIEVSTGLSATVFVAGMIMAVTPGKVGEVLKSLLLRRARGIAVARTAPIVAAERLTDFLGMGLIAAVGAIAFDYGRLVLAGAFVVGLGFLVLLTRRPWVEALLDWTEGLPLVGRYRESLGDAYESMYALVDWPILLATTLLSIVAWSMEGVALYWILTALAGGDPGLYGSFFAYSITTILGGLSFLPGGLGVTEGSLIGVLTLFDMVADRSSAAAATFLIRLATLWFGVFSGFVGMAVFRGLYSTDDPRNSTD